MQAVGFADGPKDDLQALTSGGDPAKKRDRSGQLEHEGAVSRVGSLGFSLFVYG